MNIRRILIRVYLKIDLNNTVLYEKFHHLNALLIYGVYLANIILAILSCVARLADCGLNNDYSIRLAHVFPVASACGRRVPRDNGGASALDQVQCGQGTPLLFCCSFGLRMFLSLRGQQR